MKSVICKLPQVMTTTVAALTGLLVVLLQVKIGGGFENSLDAGWGEVLNWGLVHGAQWGKNLIFTYGPLGFLSPGIPFDPATYWSTLILQHVFAAATACLVITNLRRLPFASGLMFLLATIVMGWNWSTSAALIIVYPLAILQLEHASHRPTPASLSTHLMVAALSAYAALLPLIKFSTFPLWIVWLPLGAFMLWRSRARSLVTTFFLAGLFSPVIAWLACGQHFANLPAFIATSWQVAVHYGAAMQGDPLKRATDNIALGTALFGIALSITLAWRQRGSLRRVAVCVMFALTVALAYRAGATRADGGHLGILWSVVAWCAPLLAGLPYQQSSPNSPSHSAMILALALMALTPEWFSGLYPAYTLQQTYSGHYTLAYAKQRIDQFLSPSQTYQQKIKQWASDRKKLALPKIVRTIGRDSVDVLMDSQSVLLANDLNYDPRPIFQSYSAYSGELARLNEAFFESARAPAWIMLHWRAIDDHYPTSDDSLALVRILQIYRPTLSDDAFLLFRRTATHAANSPLTSSQRHVIDLKFGSFAAIPESPSGAWFAKVDVSLTIFGKLRAMLFRQPRLRIEARMKDGSTQLYYLVRATARSGFLLSPAISDNGQYLSWLDGSNEHNVTAIRLIQKHFHGRPTFKLSSPLLLYPVKLPRESARTLALYAARYPGFNQLPVSIPASAKNFTIGPQRVLFLPAPGSLTFHLPPGTYSVSARFGLMPNALTDEGCIKAHADGIGISAGILGESPDTFAVAYLDPFSDPRHHYAANFSHLLTVGAGQMVAVSLTSGPPGSNGACDWSWIRGLKFERVASAN